MFIIHDVYGPPIKLASNLTDIYTVLGRVTKCVSHRHTHRNLPAILATHYLSVPAEPRLKILRIQTQYLST